DPVLLCYQSANRDEAAFGPTAGCLDVGRDPNPHMSFGYAEHYCLGAGLARLEGRVLFEERLARWPDYELAGEIERLPSPLARGVVHLPVLLEPGGPSPSGTTKAPRRARGWGAVRAAR